ncbi:MAG: VOC family protein [Spirochaetota bacterium]
MKHAARLHHVALNVARLDRSVDSCGRTFGMSVVRRWGDDPRAAMLDVGDGAILEMFEKPATAGQQGALVDFALKTHSVDAAYEHALAQGAAEQTAPRDVHAAAEEPYPIRIAFMKGPDGQPIKLFRERS